jgi:peptidyl-prolyl cis-trans isomerase SurA
VPVAVVLRERHPLAQDFAAVDRSGLAIERWGPCQLAMVAMLACLILRGSPPLLRADDDLPGGSAVVVARIDDEPIYRAAYVEVLKRAGYTAATTPDERNLIAARVIEELVNERLIGKLLSDRGVVVDQAEVDVMVSSLRSQLSQRKLTLEVFLSRSGRDETILRKQLATEIGLNKLLMPLLTESRLEECFQRRQQEFDGSRLRVSHVLLRPDPAAGGESETDLLTEAQRIRERIESGQLSFVEAVRRYSAGQSRLRDGDLGFVPRQGLLNESFCDVAYRLGPGEVSEPFATPFGVHLVTVTAVSPGSGSFAAARNEVKKALAAELLREMLEAARAAVRIDYSPGIPHFAGPAGDQDAGRRTIVVEPASAGSR